MIFFGLEFVKCYIDDIVVFSTSQKKHRAHLIEVFARLRLHGLKFPISVGSTVTVWST
jgi:hypothetical protein